ncbi:MAG: hypothetical protein WD578_05655 [Bacteroidales bacterium]
MKEQDNIENFFRKRLGTHEFPFQESNWKKMEEKLNAANLPSSGSGNSWSASKVVTIMAIASGVLFSALWFTRERSPEKITPTEVTAEVETAPPGSGGMESESPPSEKSRTVLQDIAESGKNEVRTADNLNEIHEPNKKKVVEVTNADISEPIQTSPELFMQTSVQKNQNHSLPVETKNAREIDIASITNDPAIPGERLRGKNLVPMGPHPPNHIPGKDSRNLSLPIPITNTGSDNTASPVNVPGRTFLSRWSGSISLSPDLTGTGLFNRKSVSPIMGARLWFAVSDRWSVSAGALYNTKKYFTNPGEYTPPEGYWENKTNGILPASIFGECTVLDIPVMVSYRVTSREKLNLSASMGMSNYLILDEYYAFEFDQPNPGSAENWSTDNNSPAGWGITNFAVNIDLRLSPAFTVSMEPYLKIPLKQMGWGNVDLYSMGSLLSMKFNLK